MYTFEWISFSAINKLLNNSNKVFVEMRLRLEQDKPYLDIKSHFTVTFQIKVSNYAYWHKNIQSVPQKCGKKNYQ